MNKTLSQQLCELVGIEPKLVNNNLTISDLLNRKIEYEKVYPDFENPVNFVRLFNLEYPIDDYSTQTITGYLLGDVCYSNFITDTTTYLKYLIISMTSYWNVDKIKQAIKNAEWEY